MSCYIRYNMALLVPSPMPAISAPLTIATAMTTSIQQAADFATEIAGQIADALMQSTLAAADSAQSATETAVQMGQEQTNTTFGVATDAALTAGDEATDATVAGLSTGQRLGLKGQDTTEKIGIAAAKEASSLSKFLTYLSNNFYTIMMLVAIFVTFFGYLKKIGEWFVMAILHIGKRATNIPFCIWFYILDMIFELLYLPIRVLLWIFDGGLGDNFKWCQPRKYHDHIIKQRHALDCYIYDKTGVHLFHYPEFVMQKCYEPKFPPFPSPADHFNKDMFSSPAKFFGF
jgi:hypothetical protein